MNELGNNWKVGRRPVVLIVDDEDTVLSFAEFILEEGGYQVLTARNSVEALHLAAGHRGTIDVLLTDVEMRIFQNGMELASCFEVLRPETKVLLTSASALPEGSCDLEKGWTFLPKPFTRQQLLCAVDNLSGVDARRANWRELAAV